MKIPITITLEGDVLKAVEKLAEERGLGKSEMVERMVADCLKLPREELIKKLEDHEKRIKKIEIKARRARLLGGE